MRTLILIVFIVLAGIPLLAQNKFDVLRYTYFQPMSSARVEGVGGAFGALGAEFAAIGINPAGVATFRTNELSFSLFHQSVESNAEFFGTPFSDSDRRLGFGNIGFVYSATDLTEQIKSFNFSVGFKRVHDFQRETIYSGFNAENSILDAYAENLNSTDFVVFPDEILDFYPDLRGQAVDQGLLQYDSATTFYFPIIAGNVQQTIEHDEFGGQSEFNITAGVNLGHKLYIGGELNFPSVNYSSVRIHEEEDRSTVDNGFQGFRQEENLIVNGSGIQAKIGAIFRPNKFLRLGASVHTPTSWSMYEEYEVVMDSYYDDFDIIGNITVLPFEYSVVTPGKWNVSSALILGKLAFVSLDYETTYMNNGKVRFNDDVDFEAEQAINDDIENSFIPFSTLRAGLELRGKVIRVRGGVANTSSPFENNDNWGILTATTGLGIKTNSWFADLSVAFQTSNYTDTPYEVSPSLGTSQGAIIENKLNRIQFTIGTRF